MSTTPARAPAPGRPGWTPVAVLTAAVLAATASVSRLGPALAGHERTLAALGVVGALVFVAWVRAEHRRVATSPALSLATALGAALLAGWAFAQGRLVVERMHVLAFAPVGFALARVLVATHGRGPGAAAALALGATIGLVDEMLQGFLPDRYYDLFDVQIDAVSVAAGVVLALPLAGAARAGAARRAAGAVALLTVAGVVATRLVTVPLLDPARIVGSWAGENPCGPERLSFAADGGLAWSDDDGNHARGRWRVTGNAFGENVLFIEVSESANRHTEPLCGLRADGAAGGLYAAPLVLEQGRFLLGGTRKRAWHRAGDASVAPTSRHGTS